MSNILRSIKREAYRLQYGSRFGDVWRQHRKAELARKEEERRKAGVEKARADRKRSAEIAKATTAVLTAKVIKRRSRLASSRVGIEA